MSAGGLTEKVVKDKVCGKPYVMFKTEFKSIKYKFGYVESKKREIDVLEILLMKNYGMQDYKVNLDRSL